MDIAEWVMKTMIMIDLEVKLNIILTFYLTLPTAHVWPG
jgi:hypothetical protein